MNNEFEYEKLKDYENKIVKEFGFNSNWEESYYGSYYFCMNQKTNKLDFLYIVSDHEYFNEITKIDGVLKISLNNNKVELEEVDKEAYNKKLCLPATYLMENFYKKIYKPNYQWYLPENNKTLKAYFKKILVLSKSKELKYFYVNNI